MTSECGVVSGGGWVWPVVWGCEGRRVWPVHVEF